MTQALPAPPRPAPRPSRAVPSGQPGNKRGGAARAEVLARCRPSDARAAAAALLVAPAGDPAKAPRTKKGDLRPELKVVDNAARKALRRRNRTRLLIAGGVVSVVAVAFLLVYVHVVMAQRQFRLDNTQTAITQEQLQYQELRYQVAQLGSPENVISTAEGRLGMVEPPNVSYLTPGPTVGAEGSSAGSAGSLSSQTAQGDADWPLIKSQLAGSP